MNDKLIVFDWGGVIESHSKNEYSFYTAAENLIRQFNPELVCNDLAEKYYSIHTKHGLETKNFIDDEWFEDVKKEFGLNCNKEDFYTYYQIFFDKIKCYQNVIEYAHNLKSKCKIGVLSNLSILDKNRLDRQVNLNEFDYTWLSFEIGYRKPDKLLYKYVEDDCKIPPKNILFIDDKQENIEEAKRRGWNTCQAFGYELDKIKRNVEEFLILEKEKEKQ